MRKSYTAAFKVKVAFEVIAGQRRVSELASRYEVSAKQIHEWKKMLLSGAPELFSDKRRRKTEDDEDEKARLYEEIGRLKIELDWLKKKSDLLFGH
jgi:putative transposase